MQDTFRLTLKSDCLAEGEEDHHFVGESITWLFGSKWAMEPNSSMESSVGINNYKSTPVFSMGLAQPEGTIFFQAQVPTP